MVTAEERRKTDNEVVKLFGRPDLVEEKPKEVVHTELLNQPRSTIRRTRRH